ncbi:MAG: MarR family winged helix-turn-helix transcriptional regulator [Acidimicrobiales bacterium]|jgi:DNA-binding MarR family transcriptional regulator
MSVRPRATATTTTTAVSRDELIQRIFALRPMMQRRFNEELHRGLHEELQSVTIHQLSVLEHLRDGAVSMRELAKSLGVSESASTAAADRLVRQGLVERLSDPADRRIVRVALTATGATLVDRVQQAASCKTSKMLGALSDTQLGQLVDIFETLKNANDEPAHPDCPVTDTNPIRGDKKPNGASR